MRLMISGGGTGGHVYPALAVVEWLTIDRNKSGALEEQVSAICWVGSEGGMEEALVSKAGISFEAIPSSALRGKSPVQLPRALATLARGFLRSLRLVKRFNPDVLFATGGYVCGPVTLAAWWTRTPVLIYLPDVEPGLAIKFLARFARRVAVTAGESLRFFRTNQAVVTGYPVRRALFECSRSEARRRLGLGAGVDSSTDLPVVLVLGGSQGAHSINMAIVDGCEQLLQAAHVIHMTGQGDLNWVMAFREQLAESERARYHVYGYLGQEMVDALLAADLAVSRAGASILGEFPAAGLPSVLVPYPYAGAHQWNNAQHLVDAGAALIVSDEDLEKDLVPTVLGLLSDAGRRADMSDAAYALARPYATQSIGRELRELAQ